MKVIPQEISVALLAGGHSGEREISLASGKGAGEALRQAGFQVTEYDPANREDLIKLLQSDSDVAFLCMHGKGGEDGTLQGFLEIAGIPYTGPGVWASSTAMDKHKAKVFYERHGINTPASVTLYADTPYNLDEITTKLGEHLVVKPAREGSALGVTIAQGKDEIAKGIENAFTLDTEILVEQFISGTELTVAVLGNEEPEALPIIEIVPQNDFYDFESKYAPGGSKHICPAPLSDELTHQAQNMAIEAHKALDCVGMSRSDIILDEKGVCWVLETNTIPGMTATSLLPDAGRAAGMEFPELCTRLIAYALESTK